MSDRTIISSDTGNGGVNAVLAKTNGRTKQFYTPSVRAMATGDTLGLGSMEMEYQYVDWHGARYVVGDDVTRVTKRGISRHMGADRYGNEFHQFLTAFAIANLGIKSGQVDLTVFAPPGLYNQSKDNIIAGFTSNPVEIRLKGDKKARKWKYSTVRVLPEGVAGVLCYTLDKHGKPFQADLLNGNILVMDGGAQTFDAVLLRNGNLNPESLDSATWEAGGINDLIRKPILRKIKAEGRDFETLTVDDIDRVIRVGLVTGDYILTHAGYEIDLKPHVDHHRGLYARWVADNIIDGEYNGLDGIKGAVLVGGWVDLVHDHLLEWYGEKIIDHKKHKTTKRLAPVDMNAFGGLRYRLYKLNEGK